MFCDCECYVAGGRRTHARTHTHTHCLRKASSHSAAEAQRAKSGKRIFISWVLEAELIRTVGPYLQPRLRAERTAGIKVFLSTSGPTIAATALNSEKTKINTSTKQSYSSETTNVVFFTRLTNSSATSSLLLLLQSTNVKKLNVKK